MKKYITVVKGKKEKKKKSFRTACFGFLRFPVSRVSPLKHWPESSRRGQ